MLRQSSPLAFLLLLITGTLTFSAPAGGEELTSLVEEVRNGILDQIDDFAVESCDPPCPGLICCDNNVCVHTVLACGMYPLQIDSFRIHGSPQAQMAGFATQGVLAAEIGRQARLFFGQLDGEAWRERGIEPGLYELVLLEGATMDHALVALVDGEGRPAARMSGHFWVFSSATSSIEAQAPDWNLSVDRLEFEACNEGSCVQLSLPLPTG